MEQIALNRYDQTWKRFIKELNNNPTITLRTVCKTMHTDYRPMKKWLSRVGYSVLEEKAAHRSMIYPYQLSLFLSPIIILL